MRRHSSALPGGLSPCPAFPFGEEAAEEDVVQSSSELGAACVGRELTWMERDFLAACGEDLDAETPPKQKLSQPADAQSPM